ncbi:hypothetical protein M0R45_036051 [Rubus argutus]|uniref:Uncharacterized protein n=1 Tax=Rubus argutus TaxID=59490 RepID=A0AAW1VXH7_RUBAR
MSAVLGRGEEHELVVFRETRGLGSLRFELSREAQVHDAAPAPPCTAAVLIDLPCRRCLILCRHHYSTDIINQHFCSAVPVLFQVASTPCSLIPPPSASLILSDYPRHRRYQTAPLIAASFLSRAQPARPRCRSFLPVAVLSLLLCPVLPAPICPVHNHLTVPSAE